MRQCCDGACRPVDHYIDRVAECDAIYKALKQNTSPMTLDRAILRVAEDFLTGEADSTEDGDFLANLVILRDGLQRRGLF